MNQTYFKRILLNKIVIQHEQGVFFFDKKEITSGFMQNIFMEYSNKGKPISSILIILGVCYVQFFYKFD